MNSFFTKLTDKVAEKIVPISEKLTSIKFIQALSETMQAIMPIVIVGSFACLLAYVDIGPWQALLVKFPMISTVCMYIQSLTLSLFSLYVMLVLPHRYATHLEMKEATACVPLTLAAFLLLTPTELYASIPTQWLGHTGLFSALVVSWGVVRLVKLFIDKNVRIKMPNGVPKFVEDAFSVLIPGAVICVVAAVVGYLLEQTSLGCFHNIIYVILQQPIKSLGLTWWGITVAQLAATLVVFCGIHGNTVKSLFDPLVTAACLENLEAWQAGKELPNIVGDSFVNYCMPGNGGALLIPILTILIFAKSERMRAAGKVALVPGIFGIGEPILFGLPVMLNALYLIPMLVTVAFNHIYSYVLIAVGLMGKFTGVTISWTVPPIINAALTNSTPVLAIIFQIIMIVIDIIIWLPFIKIADKQAIEEEKAQIE